MSPLLSGTVQDRSSDVSDAARRHGFVRTIVGGRAGVSQHDRVQAQLPIDVADSSVPASRRPSSPGPHPLLPGGLNTPPSRGTAASVARAVAVAVTAMATVAPTALAYALPLLCVLSPYSLLGTVGIGLAGFFGTLVATQLGTWLAVVLVHRLSRPPEVPPALQRGIDVELAALGEADGEGASQPTVSIGALVRQAQNARLAEHSLRGAPDRDARPETRARREGMEARHGMIRISVPCAPHARAQSAPLPTGAPVDWKRVLAYDGCAHNLVFFSGQPDAGSVWVATLLDGFAVMTWNGQLIRAGSEFLSGISGGGWGGVSMLGGEFGFTRGLWGMGARLNGSTTRSGRTSEELRLAQQADDATSLLPGAVGLDAHRPAPRALGASDDVHFLHKQVHTEAVGWVRNLAGKYRVLQLFQRQDMSRQVHHEVEQLVGHDQAAAAQARLWGQAPHWSVQGFASLCARGVRATPAWASHLLDTATIAPLPIERLPRLAELTLQHGMRRVEQALDRTRGRADAFGQSGHAKTTAATFIAQHTLTLGSRQLTLLPQPAPASEVRVAVRYVRRHHQSCRTVAAFTGGFGADVGQGALDESEWEFLVDAGAQQAIDTLHEAMVLAHHSDDALSTEPAAIEDALVTLVNLSHRRVQRSERQGSTWSQDIGGRMALFGSQWWQPHLPAGWTNAWLRQRRAMRLDERHDRRACANDAVPLSAQWASDAAAAPDAVVDAAAVPTRPGELALEHVLWAGRVTDGLSLGPLGSRSQSVWARIGYDETDLSPSVTFETEWQLGRADAVDYHDHILAPISRAFGIPLAMPFGSTWQTERSVRVRRTLTHADWHHLSGQQDEFAQAGLLPLHAALFALFRHGRGKYSQTEDVKSLLAEVLAAANQVQVAFANAFESYQADVLGRLANAMGANAQELAVRGEAEATSTLASTSTSSLTSSSSLSDAPTHELDRWTIASTTDAMAEPAGLEATLSLARCLQPEPSLDHGEQAARARAQIGPLMAMVFCDPLLGAPTRRAQLRSLQQTKDRLASIA